jgi:hypothetical protein
MYVHGVKSCDVDRVNAHFSLKTLDDEVLAEAAARTSAYRKQHPNANLVFRTRRANLYTATPSPDHPSDSANPVNMDDWDLGSPGCKAKVQGDPCTTAYEWRYRLAQEIKTKFPADAKDILLIGHSTGARTAFEVAANVGPRGVGSQDWGVQSRIAGVVSLHGMIDSLGTSKYNVVGPLSFLTLCKNSDPAAGFGSGCANGNGWCEYASEISAFPAADWVARNQRAMMLISSASCSPALFKDVSDGSLPIDAQGSPLSVGMELTSVSDGSFRPAHGERYGDFCHSSIASLGKGDHMNAVTAAKQRILDFLFVAAPRTMGTGSFDVPSVGYNQASTLDVGTSCDTGWESERGADVVGVCRHPGLTDGDSHRIDKNEFSVQSQPMCKAQVKWTQAHDKDNRHAASLTWKTRGLAIKAPALIDSFKP